MKIGNIKPPKINPSGALGGSNQNPIKKLATQLLAGFIVLFLIMGILSAVVGNSPSKEITLSELASEIRDDKVEYVHVRDQSLEIKLHDQTIQEARKEEGQLTQSLVNLGIPAEKISGARATPHTRDK